ncbi:MAG: histidine kinase dimerization/phospho-acceptor domain-containing protein [Lachnospiraceae bacterium]
MYSKKGKGILFVLQYICVIILTICITVIALFSAIRVGDLQGRQVYGLDPFDHADSFENTNSFYYILADSVEEVARYAVIREQMETAGVFNGQKKIDIEAYARRYERDVHTGSVSYYLEDLIKWGQYGLEYTDVSTNEITDSQEIAFTNPKIVERYQPIGGIPLSTYAINQQAYEALCGYLSESIESLSYNYYQYRQFQKIYQGEDTNLRYYIVTGDDVQHKFSNLPDTVRPGEEEQYIQGLGKYICYDATNLSYKTNTEMTESNLTDIMNRYEYEYSDNSCIFVGVDTTYPVKDIFTIGKENYSVIGQWTEPFLLMMMLSITAYFVLLIVLTVLSGRKQRQSEVFLLWFDHINTECSMILAAAVCSAAIGTTALVTAGAYYKSMDNAMIVTWVIIGVIISHIFLEFFYFSFIRRLKSHTFWNNSLLYRICRKLWRIVTKICKKIADTCISIFNHSKVATRTWVPYLLFLVVNIILLEMGLPFLALLFDGVMGYYHYKENLTKQRIVDTIQLIKEGDMTYQMDTTGMHGDILMLAEAVNTLGDAVRQAVETSMKDERLKADLITNVSHDIKTPLTSIINYVDLIKREDIQDDKIKGYIAILDAKSQRLKHLTEDLVEASKISSGNITLQMMKLNLIELLNQTIGEFAENFQNNNLEIIINAPEHPIIVEADSRRSWRVLENLFRNIEKYAMEHTRVYIDVTEEIKNSRTWVTVSIKNISRQPLNIHAEDLTERFIRGDISRNTEGSGLGLSIAKNLVQLQGGTFEIYLDGDLFKVIMGFQETIGD